MLRADFRLAENYIRYLTRRIYFLNDRIEELICPSTDQRVLLYLTQNAEDGRFTLAMTTLAQSLSISRASLYRALDKLEAAGRIRRDGRTIELVSARQGEPLLKRRKAYIS
jgi:DNA-binding MarR family transcriptional regulator